MENLMLSSSEVFDEESCRYFLRLVGERVVPAYPFDYGMEEVYSLILERYGCDGISDAVSLLQDFLEEDDVATGVGDDGDIWRSWRHHWRRRNHDGLNPYIPRIGLFVLPQPTPKSIRQTKADNFLRQLAFREQSCLRPEKNDRPQTSGASSTGEVSLPDSAMQLLLAPSSADEISSFSATRTTYSHQRCRLGLPHFDESIRDSQSAGLLPKNGQDQTLSTRSIADSQQDVAGAPNSVLEENTAPSHRLPFEKADSDWTSSEQQLDSGHGTSHSHTLRQIESLLPSSGMEPDLWLWPLSTRSREHETPALPEARHVKVPQKRFRHSRLSCSGEKILEEDVSSPAPKVVEKHIEESDAATHLRQSLLSEDSKSRSTPEHQRKAANRDARLVDGVFRKQNTFPNTEIERSVAVVQRNRRSSQILKWMSWQSAGNRSSWMQGVKSLFRATEGGAPNPLAKHRRTASIDRQQSTEIRWHRRNGNSASATSSMPPTNLGLLLDGAHDDHTPASSPGSRINKPLPLTPGDIVDSLSSRPESDYYSHIISFPQSTASTTSTKASKVSSKEEFKAMTNDLVQSVSMRPSELLPVQEVDARYRCQRSNASKPIAALASPLFTTTSQLNPFTDASIPSTPAPDISTPLQMPYSNSNRFSFGLPASQSAPNLSCRVSSPPPPIPLFYNTQGIPQSPPFSSPEPPESKRTNTRSRSHTHTHSDGVNDMESSRESRRRPAVGSRSPVKRMLCLGKITAQSGSHTPSSSTEKVNTLHTSPKRSFRQWTNKLRHGFLTADQEEAHRESQIDEYMDQAAKPSPQIEPPSTFSISLDPAHQARLQADMELMIVVSANRFMLKEAEAGRLAPPTISAARRAWEKRNLPQVIEYLYDQATQRELILANFQALSFCGSVGRDAVALNSTMHRWGVLAREMNIRTFCAGDSVIRKWLHDARCVLEMLGAPLITFLAYQDLEVKTLARITQRQYQRAERNAVEGHSRNTDASIQTGPLPRRDWSASSNYGLSHRRKISDGSHKYNELPAGLEHLNLSPTPSPRHMKSVKGRKPTGTPGIPKHGYSSSNGSIYENSRGVRLGQMMHHAQPSAPHEHSQLHYATTPTRTQPAPHLTVTTPILTPIPSRRHEAVGDVSLKRGLWSDRRPGGK